MSEILSIGLLSIIANFRRCVAAGNNLEKGVSCQKWRRNEAKTVVKLNHELCGQSRTGLGNVLGCGACQGHHLDMLLTITDEKTIKQGVSNG